MESDPKKDSELILDIGVEGGGLTLYGRQLKATRWEFWLSSNSMGLDENDDEVWHHYKSEVVTTWKKALTLVYKRAEKWILFYPTTVHPLFRTRIQAELDKQVLKLTENELDYWQRHASNNWRHILEEPSAGLTSG